MYRVKSTATKLALTLAVQQLAVHTSRQNPGELRWALLPLRTLISATTSPNFRKEKRKWSVGCF